MKITNNQLMASVPHLNELSALKLPAKAAYRVAKALRIVNNHAEDFEKARFKALSNYALKDQEGNPIVTDGQVQVLDRAKFQAEMQELMLEEIEINVPPVSLADLGEQNISVRALAELDWFVVE